MKYYAIFAVLLGWNAYLLIVRAPRDAFWRAWMVAMLICPVYFAQAIGGFSLDMRTAVAMICLAAIFVTTRPLDRFKVVPSDIAVILLFCEQVFSEFRLGGLTPMAGPDLARRWILPYIVGRFFFFRPIEIRKSAPFVTYICFILFFLASFEAVARMNPIAKPLGKRIRRLEQAEGFRWGIKRAHGNLTHPIYFGMVLTLVFPWVLEARRMAKEKKGGSWILKYAPAYTFIAVVLTASRGPIIACLSCVYITKMFQASGRAQKALFAIALIGGGSAYVAKDAVVELLGSLTGVENTGEDAKWVKIKGKEYLYTGTLHRELLDLVYEDGKNTTGLWGHGYAMRTVKVEPHLAHRFGSVDNHYLLFLLQRGHMGYWLFIALAVTSVGNCLWIAYHKKLVHAPFAAAMSGGLIGVTVLLKSVWFAPDHGIPWLFVSGITACLMNLPKQETEDPLDVKREKRVSDVASKPGREQREAQIPDPHLPHKPAKKRRVFHGHAPVRSSE
ncbi:MAG: hypothetical protein ACI9HK_003196 [Pirellulaceae bacterium]|jgi:hypothetical protein